MATTAKEHANPSLSQVLAYRWKKVFGAQPPDPLTKNPPKKDNSNEINKTVKQLERFLKQPEQQQAYTELPKRKTTSEDEAVQREYLRRGFDPGQKKVLLQSIAKTREQEPQKYKRWLDMAQGSSKDAGSGLSGQAANAA
ncbi:MAG: hypothetical protein Q9159_003885 [Coniocarpon cinnabarinum]